MLKQAAGKLVPGYSWTLQELSDKAKQYNDH